MSPAATRVDYSLMQKDISLGVEGGRSTPRQTSGCHRGSKMCGFYNKPGRDELRFESSAKAAFSWLVNFGFCLFEGSATMVRYRGPLGHVTVYHGRSSLEVGVEVGPPLSTEDNFAMSELIRLEQPEKAESYRNPVATTPSAIENALSNQASRLRKYGRRVWEGDISIWTDLEKQRIQWAQQYSQEVLLSQSRPVAEAAFRNRDFQKVVTVLAEVEDLLTPAERSKLRYARKKLLG